MSRFRGLPEHRTTMQIEVLGELFLEQQRDVAQHDAVAALASLRDALVAQPCDFGVHDRVQRLQLVLVAEDQLAQGGAVERPIARHHVIAPPPANCLEGRRPAPNRDARQFVRIDERDPPLREQLGHRALTARDVAR